MSDLDLDTLVARLHYQGKQYSNGRYSRGGGGEKHMLTQAAETITTLLEEVADYEDSFDLYSAAADRGRDMFCKAHGPEWDMKAPDTGHLICWLMKQLSELQLEKGDD